MPFVAPTYPSLDPKSVVSVMIAIPNGSKTQAMNKVYKDAAAALHDVFDGCTILA